MELENHAGLDLYVLVVLVDGRQHVPIASDLRLVAVPRLYPLGHELREAAIRRTDPLDTVGSPRALDPRLLAEFVEDVGFGREVEVLPTLELMDGRRHVGDVWRHEDVGKSSVVERPHYGPFCLIHLFTASFCVI